MFSLLSLPQLLFLVSFPLVRSFPPFLDCPGGSGRKESACIAGDLGSTPGLVSSSEEGDGYLLGESHGQRSLVGYSPWAHNESDTTERLNALALGPPFFPLRFIHCAPCVFSGLSRL